MPLKFPNSIVPLGFRHLRRRDGRLQGLGERPGDLFGDLAVVVAQQTLDHLEPIP
ncbi:Uncharacterised protein [Mycobacterium tuberculosis]|nr:Uncharacterised protein [Mycobacterium tuberculosis]